MRFSTSLRIPITEFEFNQRIFKGKHFSAETYLQVASIPGGFVDLANSDGRILTHFGEKIGLRILL